MLGGRKISHSCPHHHPLFHHHSNVYLTPVYYPLSLRPCLNLLVSFHRIFSPAFPDFTLLSTISKTSRTSSKVSFLSPPGFELSLSHILPWFIEHVSNMPRQLLQSLNGIFVRQTVVFRLPASEIGVRGVLKREWRRRGLKWSLGRKEGGEQQVLCTLLVFCWLCG